MKRTGLRGWHQTKQGHLVFGVVELLAAYLLGSRALDTGSLIEYAITITLFVGAIRNFVKLIGKIIHNDKAATTR